jgi:hypothetical protein
VHARLQNMGPEPEQGQIEVWGGAAAPLLKSLLRQLLLVPSRGYFSDTCSSSSSSSSSDGVTSTCAEKAIRAGKRPSALPDVFHKCCRQQNTHGYLYVLVLLVRSCCH